MPRANRYSVAGAAYHLTHRCHNRQFLLKTAQDRDSYRKLLREAFSSSAVSLLGYTITSNHVHLLVASNTQGAVGSLMQLVQGQFAGAYNRRKKREGAYWSDRYHATMIDSGQHLLACLRYIDLNMVRAGVVRHPQEWPWTGWHELVGERKRYRLIDSRALLDRLDATSWPAFQKYYRGAIEDALMQKEACRRDGRWTESLAVGSSAFTKRVEAQIILARKRSRTTLEEGDGGRWTLRETAADYALERSLGANSGF